MILPEFQGQRFSLWNADEWAREWEMQNSTIRDSARSQFLIPAVKEGLNARARKTLSADVLYGGWMENRSDLWRGSYMEPTKFRHTGVDFTAPAGTPVCIDQRALLIQVYSDVPEPAGWGTRLMFQLLDHPGFYLVFGHLRPDPLLHVTAPGSNLYRPGQLIGYLGTPEQNGGWAPHLHVQAILGDVQKYLEDPASLDGYGELDELEYLSGRFPDPIRFIEIR